MDIQASRPIGVIMKNGFFTLIIDEKAKGDSIKKEIHEFLDGILIKIYEIHGNGKVIEYDM